MTTPGDGSPPTEFALPDVGEGLHEAEIVQWLVAVGDDVGRDQPLVEILTDKSATELPSPVAGRVASIGPAEGDVVEVGTVLITINPKAPEHEQPAQPTAPDHPNPTGTKVQRNRASPSTRRLAARRGIDLATVAGSGPGGRILATDLDRVGAVTAPSPAADSVVTPVGGPGAIGWMEPGEHALRGVRRVIATTMAQAWSEIPHIHAIDELDATNLLDVRRRTRTGAGERGATLTPLAFLVAACARALRRYPMVNASIDAENGTITVHPDVHIGIAVATDAGLVVPVIRHADRLDVVTLGEEIARLSGSARANTLGGEEMRGGTFTVTNYGSLGGSYALPIIRPPEAAIIGFGAVKDRPIVVDGDVVARPTLPVVIGADHRLIDGDLSTAFHQHVIAQLSDPLALVLGG